jgi:hypothetical protein
MNIIDQYKFDPSGATDNAGQFAQMAADIAALPGTKVKPRYVFPEGVYRSTAIPNLAFNNLELVGEGQCEWHYDGTGDAVTFDGNSAGGGVFNMFVDGIRVVPTAAARDTVVIRAVHHSSFRIKAYGAGAPRGGARNRAVALFWCVKTAFYDLSISPFDVTTGGGSGGSFDCIGLWLDKVTQPADWQTTVCKFYDPVIENTNIGAWLMDAGGCLFSGGTIESSTDTGLKIDKGGQNRSWGLWLENNKNWDVVFGSGAKSNNFETSHPSSLKVSGASFWLGNYAS